mgnify:CR=1 FL=1
MFFTTRKRFTAWIIFAGADHRRFWRIFTRRGWRHCYVILPAYYPEPGLRADQYSVIIDTRTNCTDCDVLFTPPKDVVQYLLKEGTTCAIKVRIDRHGKRDYVPRGILTCVSLVKSIIGIGAWWVWTPEQLARHLVRNGGELITQGESDV